MVGRNRFLLVALSLIAGQFLAAMGVRAEAASNEDPVQTVSVDKNDGPVVPPPGGGGASITKAPGDAEPSVGGRITKTPGDAEPSVGGRITKTPGDTEPSVGGRITKTPGDTEPSVGGRITKTPGDAEPSVGGKIPKPPGYVEPSGGGKSITKLPVPSSNSGIAGDTARMKQKSWNPANFRVKLGDLPSTSNAGNAAKAGNAANAGNAAKLNSLIRQPGTAKLMTPAVKPR